MGTRVFAWAVIIGGLVAVIGLVAMLVRGLGNLPVIIVLLVLAVLGMIYLWRFALYPRVVVEDRLWVVNPMHTHILDADEVLDIRPGPDGLVVHHPEGSIEAWAVQKSTGALRKDRRTRADQVAEALLAALRGATPTDTEPATEPSTDDEVVTAEENPLVDTDAEATVADPADDTDDPDDGDDGDDDLIIRRAHRDDLATLVALEEEINTEALAHIFSDGEPFPTDAVSDRWETALADRAYKVRVAEIDGRPVGYLCYDAEQLHQIGLLSDHSGRGHGRALLEYAIDDMVARGADTARLQVLEGNTDARDFYRHLGWVETGDRRPCPYPPHPTELTMTIELDGEAS